MTLHDILLSLGLFSISSVISYVGYKLAMYYSFEKPMREFCEKHNLELED